MKCPAWCWVALLAALGCQSPASGRGPAVLLVDSLVLAQPDVTEEFLPLRTQALTANGAVVLETGTRILHFSPDGRLIRVMGRAGNGPGEFVRISSLGVLPGDSLVAAVDARRARIVVYGLADGVLRREVSLAPPFYPDQQWVFHGDTVTMPRKLSALPFTSWHLPSDSIWHWGAAPSIFTTSIGAYSQGGEPSLAPSSKGWLALFPAEAELHVLHRDGSLESRLTLPVRRRVGVPPHLADSVALIAASDSFRLAASVVLAIRQLSDGRYALIHLDTDTKLIRNTRDPAGGGARVAYSNMRYWVTLLTADATRACVDGLVPMSVDNVLSPTFRADTLVFISRAVAETDELRTVLYKFVVDDRGCDWLPTAAIP